MPEDDDPLQGLPPAPEDYPEPSFPELVQASNFEVPSADYAAEVMRDKDSGYVYSRYHNPTVSRLQQSLSALEGAESAVCLASGMAAIGATLLTHAGPGGKAVQAERVYGGTWGLSRSLLPDFDIEVETVDATDPESVASALPGADLLLLETPDNPLLTVSDIEQLSSLAADHDVVTAVDSTFATPMLQKPLELGADLVIHSTTKFISGHGAATGGAVLGPEELVEPVKRRWVHSFGAMLDPFAAWMTLHGLRTLEVRMERASASALKLAAWMQTRPEIAHVRYPFLNSHPQVDLAKHQMESGGAMITFELAAGYNAATQFIDSLGFISHQLSLGDTTTSVLHPASTSHAALDEATREELGITGGMVRLSTGLEDPDRLIDDLAQALSEL